MTRPATQDRETRALNAFTALVDDLDRPAVEHEPLRPVVDLASRTASIIVASVALLAVLMVHLVASQPYSGPAGTEEPAVLPSPFPVYSHLAATIEETPPGPVLMTFTHGIGVEFLDLPRSVALGANGKDYRHIATAKALSIEADQGDPGASLVSPDGRTIAIGSSGDSGVVVLLDTTTGTTTRLTARDGSHTVPMLWTGDSRSVLVRTAPGERNKYGPPPDAATRAATEIVRVTLPAEEGGRPTAADLPAELDAAHGAAALPGHQGMLVELEDRVQLRSHDGVEVLVDDTGIEGTPLHNAASPDGRRVVTRRGGELWLTELEEGRAASARPLEVPVPGYDTSPDPDPGFLGWTGPDSVLIRRYDNQEYSLRMHLWQVGVDDASTKELSVAETGWTGASVTEPTFAGDLLATAVVDDPGPTNRGYLALGTRLLMMGVGVVGVVRLLRWLWGLRWRRVRP